MKNNLTNNLTAQEDAKMGGGMDDLKKINREYEEDLFRKNYDEKKAIQAKREGERMLDMPGKPRIMG